MTRTLDWVSQDALANEQVERQQAVLTLLHQFQGIEPLKQLFWSELNYDRVNKPLSRRGWNDGVAGLLADDPVLFASGSDAFHIIYARLASDKLRIGDERPVVSKLLQEHPYALSVFSNSTQDQFHFLNVKYDDDVQKRRLFRRITVGRNEQLRTASERIAMLDLAGISPDLFGPSPIAIQQRHDLAFDVEPVTKEFFHEYGRIFEEVEEAITGFRKDKDRKRLYTQRLFNRLMFIAFIQKKGWLKFNGSADYLATLWKAHLKDNSVTDKNFYRDRLKPLFFHGLNTTNEVNRIGINRGGFLKTLIGDVPYLNGGLFEDDEDDNDENIKVPDKSTGTILNGLFGKFNFTVTESTPLDLEVAIDPEMLGRIFEELVTGRHESGSYYTPKPIVSFMCREALKGYLESNTLDESKDAIERLIEMHEPDDLRNAENVLDALRRVKVCDPACGSGAYLLGMLHELLDLRAALFQSKKLDAKSVYDRKLEIIQTNTYGVDLDQFAVNIARLRLWLSLAVDFEGKQPEPLPNLDFKVEVGDSILGPNPSGGLEMGFRKQLIDEFLAAKAEYLTAHHSHKLELKKKIYKLRADIASFNGHKQAQGFDWAVEFAEVFIDHRGFDIVLANPPYVRQELITDIKPNLKSIYGTHFSGTADLYCYFYMRAIELLGKSGRLVFISPNKWLRSQYGVKLREFLSSSGRIVQLVDFGELPIFQSAATFPMVIVCDKESEQDEFRVTYVTSLAEPYPNILALTKSIGFNLPPTSIVGATWKLSDPQTAKQLDRMVAGSISLAEYTRGNVHRGVLTGCNEAFVIDSETRARLISKHKASSALIKPLVVGDDVRKWSIRTSERWLIFARRGTEISKFPAVLEYLKQWEVDLEPRPRDWPRNKSWPGRKPGAYKWFEIQDEIAFFESFEKPKIVYPEIAKESRFAFDRRGLFTNNKAFIITMDDLYLLGVLNSSAMWNFAKNTCAVLGDENNGGRLMLQWTNFGKVPIPKADVKDRALVSELVEKCLQRPDNCGAYELELNEIVNCLYGLSRRRLEPVC